MNDVEVRISADGVIYCSPEGLTPLMCGLWVSGGSICDDCPIKKVVRWLRV